MHWLRGRNPGLPDCKTGFTLFQNAPNCTQKHIIAHDKQIVRSVFLKIMLNILKKRENKANKPP